MTEHSTEEPSGLETGDTSDGDSNRGDANSGVSSSGPAAIRQAAGLGAGLIVLGVTAWLTGKAVSSPYGEWGLILLWIGGYGSGMAAKTVMGGVAKPVGVVLVVGCYLAALFAETYYLRYSTEQGQAGWITSIGLLPQFAQQYVQSTAIAAIASTLGAVAAYRETAARYEYVRVERK